MCIRDSYGPNITQEFSSKGNYTITLEVTDAAGNSDTKSFYVLVKKPPKKEEPGFGLLIALLAVTAAGAALTVRRRL